MDGLRISLGVVGGAYVAIGLTQASYGDDIAVAAWLWPSVWIVAGLLTISSAVWFRWARLRLWAGAWLMLANLSRAVLLLWSLMVGPLSSAPFTFQKATVTAILRDLLLMLLVFELWTRVVLADDQRRGP